MTLFRKHIIFVFLLFIISKNVAAQQIKIIDATSDEPLEFVLISQLESTSYVMTDEEGIANLSILDKNENYITTLLGYNNDTISWKNLAAQNFIIKLTAASFIIDPIIVSTSRWRQNNGNTPARIANIRSSEIALTNPQTTADLLSNSGEVFIQKSQQGGGSPMIRGFSANRLLYAVDGVRMNTAIFRSGNLQNVISLDPFSIESTDILFGPGSVSYGSDAIGGVMSFNTKQHKISDTGYAININQRFSSANNESSSHADISYGNKKVSGITSISYNRYGDLRMGKNNGHESYKNTFYVNRENDTDLIINNPNPLIQKNTGFDQYHLMQKIRFIPNEFRDFQLAFHYSTTSDYDRYDRLIRLRDGLPRSAEWYYGPQSWLMANLQLKNNKSSKLADKTILRIAYQNFGESRNDRDLNSFFLRQRQETVHAYSLNYDLIKTLTSNTELGYGFEGVYNKVISSGNELNVLTNQKNFINARYPNSDWYSSAVFANLTHKVSKKFLISGGARINQYGLYSRFDTTLFSLPYTTAKISDVGFSGALGMTYRPSDLTFLSLNLSSGFRAPNVDDLGKVFDSTPGNVVVPNPNLTAEKAFNIELSISQVLFNKLRLDLTGYYIRLKDGMVRRDFSFNGLDSMLYDGEISRVQATINAAKIDVAGIQAGIEFNFAKSYSFYGRINIQAGEEELDDGSLSPSRHASPFYGLVRLSKNFRKLDITLENQFSGGYTNSQLPITEKEKPYLYAVDENNQPFSPSWNILNLTTNYTFSKTVSSNFMIENILDKQYRPYSSGLTAPGRNFVLSASFKF